MKIRVDIVSDMVCPWCFIGKRRLEQALAALSKKRPGLEIATFWHPFQLNPDTPLEGEPYLPYLERKFGGAVQVGRLWEGIREAGAEIGIEFRFEDIAVRPNTLLAHRLIHRTQARGDNADTLVEGLFASHFQGGEDIGASAVLARIAGEAGEDRESVAAYLASGQDAETVLGEIQRVARLGISGVPFFIINQCLAVSGAQAPHVLIRAMEKAMDGQ